jgi:hypothetical protein
LTGLQPSLSSSSTSFTAATWPSARSITWM